MKLVHKDEYFLELSRYIRLDPIEAHLMEWPEDYLYEVQKGRDLDRGQSERGGSLDSNIAGL